MLISISHTQTHKKSKVLPPAQASLPSGATEPPPYGTIDVVMHLIRSKLLEGRRLFSVLRLLSNNIFKK